jgi:uncharacterized protein (UPF0335 family)
MGLKETGRAGGSLQARSDDQLSGLISSSTPSANANQAVKAHFDRAVELLETRAAVLADTKAWRAEARGDGLDPAALLALAREHLLDADQRRKAAERAEIEELYRQCLGLPLFDYARGAAR